MLDLNSDEDDEYVREYSFEPEILVKRKKKHSRRSLPRQDSFDSYYVGKNQIDIEVEAFYDVSFVTETLKQNDMKRKENQGGYEIFIFHY